MEERHDPYAALRHSDYLRVFLGSLLASTAAEMNSVAVGWELYQRTKSPAALGWAGFALFVPVLLLSLPAGHVIDRYSRKNVLISAQTVMAVVSLGLAALSFFQGPVLLIYVLLVGAGIAQAFLSPARAALVPQLVPPAALTNAVTWNTSTWHIASVVGPALGGLLIALVGAGQVYLLAALGCVASMGAVAGIRNLTNECAREELSLDSLFAGIRFIRGAKLILATITLDLFAVLLGGATALLPIFAEDILKVGATGLGWLRAAPSSGALLVAVLLAHRPPFRRAGSTLLWSVAGFGVATIVFGLSQSFLLSFIMLVAIGALDQVSVVVRGTLVQVLTPDTMRGRVSAVNAVFISSSNELGGFESGMTAQWFGPVASVVGGGIGTLFVVFAVLLKWPEILRLGSLHAVEPVSVEEEVRR